MIHLQDIKHQNCVLAVSVILNCGHAFQTVDINFAMTAILDIFIRKLQRVWNASLPFVQIKSVI